MVYSKNLYITGQVDDYFITIIFTRTSPLYSVTIKNKVRKKKWTRLYTNECVRLGFKKMLSEAQSTAFTFLDECKMKKEKKAR